jgi:transcriptional regulator with XRE-family HTH domain
MLNTIDVKDQLPERLKAYRLDRYWSLAKMARETGVAHSTIWKIEKRICKASDLTITKIFKRLPDLRKEIAA